MLRERLIIRITLLILLLWGSPILYVPQSYAQGSGRSLWGKVRRIFTGRPREDERTSSAGKGGANRDRCPYTTEELIAIVPVSAESGAPYLEKTVSDYPKWWFYVPYFSNRGMQSEFVLIDSKEQIIYKNISAIPEAPGLMEVSLPKANAPLSVGENYRWVFSIICNPANRSGDATVNGWIQRTKPIEVAVGQERYVAYAESLHWFDLLHEVDRLRVEKPAVFNPIWEYLLCQVYSQSQSSSSLTQKCINVNELELPQSQNEN